MADWIKGILKDSKPIDNKSIILSNNDYSLIVSFLFKQNKTIQRMAMYISAQDIDEDICKNSSVCPENDGKRVTNDDCIKCIIKYFSEVE